jgi:hypothetical protein
MNKEFVTYEQALELKELGFDESCFGVYSEHDKTRVYDESAIREGLKIQAPLYQQAFRWFREKHGLFVAPSVISYENDPYLWFFEINSTILPIGTYLEGTDDYKTYEEAEQACLDKLIEICKTK